MSHLALVALVERDYDAAIRFFVDVLQFQLVEDTPSPTDDGRPNPMGESRFSWSCAC
jgi:catechol 2,3-dioxygenase-like lactoylglutathione lyase family enzyme